MVQFDSTGGVRSNAGKERETIRTLLWRAVRLRCPVCGRGKMFQNWLRMNINCPSCGFRFQREAGYWLGSIYVNYGLTALLVTAAYFALFFSEAMSQTAVLWLLTAFCVLFPLWFFRYARSIWIAFDVYVDPPKADELATPADSDLG